MTRSTPQGFSALLALFFLATAGHAAIDGLESDAWSIGMGGATAAVGGGTHAFFVNPAGTARAVVPMAQWGGAWRSEDGPWGGSCVFLFPAGDGSVFGGGVSRLQTDGVERDQTLQFSAALPLDPAHRWMAGAALKSLFEKKETSPAGKGHGLSLDLGLLYDLPLPEGDTLSLGAALRDASGSLRFDGGREEKRPRHFTLAAAYQRRALLRLEADCEWSSSDPDDTEASSRTRLRLGAERFLGHRRFSVRAGYDDLLGDDGSFTLGAGYHPDRPFELQGGLGLSEKDSSVRTFFSAAYRFDSWKGRAWSGDRVASIDLGEAGPPSEGRPISSPPVSRLLLSVVPPVIHPSSEGPDHAATFTLAPPLPARVDRWVLNLRAQGAGVPLYVLEGAGAFPATFVWEGKDNAGHSVPDGRYEGDLLAYQNGMLTAQGQQTLKVQTGVPRLGLSALTRAFSPGNPKARSQVTFSVSTETGARWARWEFSVNSIDGRRLAYVTRGVGRPPKQIVWKGRGTQGGAVPEGAYLCLLTADTPLGASIVSEPVTVAVDRTAPHVDLGAPQPIVEPGTGPYVFQLDARDAFGIGEWVLRVTDEAGAPFLTVRSKGAPPARWSWDGRGDRGGESARPGSFFAFTLEAKDLAGNTSTSGPVGFQILPARESVGKQMTLNLATVFFPPDTARLEDEAVKDLRGAIESIRPYLAKSTLLVKGGSAGDETGNPVLLSHARAAAVRDFLAQGLGVDPSKIAAVGVGSTEPLRTSEGTAPADKQRRAVVSLATAP